VKRVVAGVLAIVLLAVGCSGPGAAGSASQVHESPASELAPLKQITVRVSRAPDARPGAAGPAMVIQPLVHSGLTVLDGQNVRYPVLAEAIPSLENGLWKLFPDGRMETTWSIRSGAQWHDGTPLSTDDLLFSLDVGQDPQLSALNTPAYRSIEKVTAVDARTLVITWKEPSILAEALFQGAPDSSGLLPRRLLEDAYRSDKATFFDLPFWTQGYVGTGPYQVREWDPGVGVTLDANIQYVLGRPKIDRIDVKLIPDANTGMANLLAGTVDVTSGVGSISLGLELRDQWRDGTVAFNFGQGEWEAMFPQFIDPHPAILADVRFRRALLYAIDRQEIADTLAGGVSPVAHSFLNPNQAQYRDIEAALPRYEFDPRQAAELLQELGYAKGPDGMYHDAAGQPLEVEVRSTSGAAIPLAAAIAVYWERLGVAATPDPLTTQQMEDPENLATFPAFLVSMGRNDVAGLPFLHSSATRLPSNKFRVPGGGNTSRYMNAQLDTLLGTYFETLAIPERTQVLGKIINQVADEVTIAGLFYNPAPGAFSNRMVNVSQVWPGPLITWNAYEWDITS